MTKQVSFNLKVFIISVSTLYISFLKKSNVDHSFDKFTTRYSTTARINVEQINNK